MEALLDFFDSPIDYGRPTKNREFRLLCLRGPQNKYDQQLWGNLSVYNVDEMHGKYIAVSYVWGPPVYCEEIHLTTARRELYRPLPITKSLYDALKEVVSTLEKNKLVMVWADGICINQSSQKEREHQVSLMRDIYFGAEVVHVNLGISKHELKLIQRILSLQLDRKLIAHMAKKRIFGRLSTTKIDQSILNNSEWQLIDKIRRHAWWQRCWTLQEALLAKNLVIFRSKRKAIDLRYFAQIMFELAQAGVGLDTSVDPSVMMRMACIAHPKGERSERLPLLQLMWETHNAKAKIEHDRLFSLLGVAKEGEAPELAPSYEEGIDETRLRFCKYLIRNGDGQSLLHLCFDKDGGGKLPSWIPPLYSYEPLNRVERSESQSRTEFIWPEQRGRTQIRLFDNVANVLQVIGVFLGTIVDTGKLARHLPGDRNRNEPDPTNKLLYLQAWAKDLVELMPGIEENPFRCTCHGNRDFVHIARILLNDHSWDLDQKLEWVDNDDELIDFGHFLRWEWQYAELPKPLKRKLSLLRDRLHTFVEHGQEMCWLKKKLYRTDSWMFGLADYMALPGDVLFAPDGQRILLLRQTNSVARIDPCYRIIGSANMYKPDCWSGYAFQKTKTVYIV